MRSFLLEYTKRDEENTMDTKVDIHVNLWSINSQKSEDSPRVFLDFGFMVDDIKNVSHIILYCPFEIKEVKDLGKNLFQKTNLIEAIFNENCEVRNNIHPNRIKVIKKGDDFKSSPESNEAFILYKLDDSKINLSNHNGFGRVEIDVENILSGNEPSMESLKSDFRYYFRIRISPSDGISDILKRENETINLLQDSSLRTTEIIDFRINDFRSVADNLREEVFRLNAFDISSVHYLIMRDATDEFVSGNNEYKSRILEKEVWKDYIRLSGGDVIAYHFKKISKGDERGITSFTNLSRFKYPLNIRKRIIWYVMAIILISILANILYSILYNILPSWECFLQLLKGVKR